MKEKRGLGDCPQGFDLVFDFDFVFPRAFLPEARFPRGFCGNLAQARALVPIFSRFWRKDRDALPVVKSYNRQCVCLSSQKARRKANQGARLRGISAKITRKYRFG
ncbi:MAG: hypothetical protein HQL84_04680 [Magnetococcales bacterium]|nr:hypothetical protein [Magnetococcales bacterium]MBF0149324.1 hypothetical protein [Magnetococcales bacterium]